MPSRRIAVVIREMEGPYQEQLVRAVRRIAGREGLDLMFFAGRGLGAGSEFERQFAITYGLAETAPVLGLIVVGGTLGRDADPHLVRVMLERQAQRHPMVAIGTSFDVGCPEIKGDNRGGMRAMVEHLVTQHGCSRFAYMHGARGSVDSVERYHGLIDALADHGLQMAPEHECWGEFNAADALTAVRSLMPRIGELDVLVCANDAMAQAAIQELSEAGHRVPQDLRVVGYDDAYGSGDFALPITSVAQDIEAQAELAVTTLVALAAKRKVPSSQIVPARLSVRTSCGCGHHLFLEAGQRIVPDWVVAAEPALAQALHDPGQPDAHFLDCFANFATFASERGLRHADLVETLLRLQHAQAADAAAAATLVAQRLVLAVALLAGLERRVHRIALPPFRLNSETFAGRLREGVRGHRREDMQNALFQALGMVGVRSAFVATYTGVGHVDAQGATSIPPESRVLFAMLDGRPMDLGDQEFPTTQLLPWTGIARERLPICVVQPLFNYGDHYGYCVLAVDGHWRISLEELRDGISSVVCGRLVIAELERARDRLRNELEQALRAQDSLSTQALQDDLTGLANRRGLMQGLKAMGVAGGEPPHLLLTDLDGLKEINDRFGHAEGDRAILAFANALRSALPPRTVCARLGGDEFAALIPGLDPAAWPALYAGLGQEVAATGAALQSAWELEFSHGIAAMGGFSVPALVDALRSADELLYQEKTEHKRLRARDRDRRHTDADEEL